MQLLLARERNKNAPPFTMHLASQELHGILYTYSEAHNKDV
jgi:hypothetical protein